MWFHLHTDLLWGTYLGPVRTSVTYRALRKRHRLAFESLENKAGLTNKIRV